MKNLKIAFFSLLTLSTVLTNNLVGQTWSENFNSSTSFSDYTSKGYSFSSNCTGAGCYSIGTTPRSVTGWNNSLQIPESGTNFFNYSFTTGYVNLTGTSSISFQWDQANNSHRFIYNVRLISTTGDVINVVTNGDKGNGNSGTVTTNFTETGFYRVQFEFVKTTSGNGSSHIVVDNFTSNITQHTPFLLELGLSCNTYKSFGDAGALDSISYETIIVNNGPDTVLVNAPIRVTVSLPSSPLMTFDDYIAPTGTTLTIDANNSNIAVWEISRLRVGQSLTLTSISSYSNLSHGIVISSSSIIDGIPTIYTDPNLSNNTSNCFIQLLPVSLSKFTAYQAENAVSVNWTTTSETNNQGFEVYSSTDANNWEYLGFVEGAGNSNAETNYRYIDNNPLVQARFYKLVQVDYDGKTEEFSPIRIDIDNRFLDKNISVFPNPSNGIVSINIISTHTVSNIGNTEVNVYSITGQTVHNVALDFATTNLQSIDLSHLPKGQYILKFSSSDQVHTVKVILQ